VLLLGLVVAYAVTVHDAVVRREAACEDARRRALADAERDLAEGTPWILRALRSYEDLDADGIGLDRETGVPLRNTADGYAEAMGGGADGVYDDAYRARIRAAYSAGALGRCSLAHKLRDEATIDALFARSDPTRLAEDGNAATDPSGKYRLVYHRDSVLEHVSLDRESARSAFVRLHHASPEEGGTFATGPLDVLFADDDTTAILRDAEGYAWVVDLPRALVVQRIGVVR